MKVRLDEQTTTEGTVNFGVAQKLEYVAGEYNVQYTTFSVSGRTQRNNIIMLNYVYVTRK